MRSGILDPPGDVSPLAARVSGSGHQSARRCSTRARTATV